MSKTCSTPFPMSEPLRRVVFDANVWVSAILSITGFSSRAISAVRLGYVRSLLSEAIVSQTRLALYRIDFDPFLLSTAIVEMRALSEIVVPTSRLTVITAKDSDNRILECAVAGHADLIVTGDRQHLLPLGAYAGIPIVTPAEFVASLAQ